MVSEGISTGTSENMIALISRWTSNGIAKFHAGTIIRKAFKATSVGKVDAILTIIYKGTVGGISNVIPVAIAGGSFE